MLAATSVGQSSKSTGTRSGRYRPNHGKIFVDRLQIAKREKEDLKIKSVDSSTAYNRLTYIVVNIRKKTHHKVEIKVPFVIVRILRRILKKNYGKISYGHYDTQYLSTAGKK